MQGGNSENSLIRVESTKLICNGFQVRFVASYSDDSLVGPAQVDLQAEETGIFKFYYAPLFPGNDVGSVSLISEEVILIAPWLLGICHLQ